MANSLNGKLAQKVFRDLLRTSNPNNTTLASSSPDFPDSPYSPDHAQTSLGLFADGTMHHRPACLLGIRPGHGSGRVTSPVMILYTVLHSAAPHQG